MASGQGEGCRGPGCVASLCWEAPESRAQGLCPSGDASPDHRSGTGCLSLSPSWGSPQLVDSTC